MQEGHLGRLREYDGAACALVELLVFSHPLFLQHRMPPSLPWLVGNAY